MYVLIQPKLPLHSVGRIVNKVNTLINKVRQPPSIRGYQIRNPPLIKGNQRGGGPKSVSKGAHNRISTCEASAQIPICPITKANSFIKKLNGKMPKRL